MPSVIFNVARMEQHVRLSDGTYVGIEPTAGGGTNVLKFRVNQVFGDGASDTEIASDTIVTASRPIETFDIDAGPNGFYAFGSLKNGAQFDAAPEGYDINVRSSNHAIITQLSYTSATESALTDLDIEVLDFGSTVIGFTEDGLDGSGLGIGLHFYDIFGVRTNTVVFTQGQAGDQSDIDITRLGDGDIALAWLDNAGGNSVAKLQLMDANGNTIGPVRDISRTRTTDAEQLETFDLSDGGVAVAWVDGTSGGAFFRIVNEDGTFRSTPRMINPDADRADVSRAAILELSDGSFIAAYGQEFPTATTTSIEVRVFFQRFDASLSKVGGPIDTGVTDFQSTSSLVIPEPLLLFEGDAGGFMVGIEGRVRMYDQASVNVDLIQMDSAGVVDAGGGGDIIVGSGGDDTILGGGGADYLDGGAGNDSIRLQGTTQDQTQTAIGGDGNDTIIGGSSATDSDEFLFGDAGNDRIIAKTASTIDGGADDDFIRGSSMEGDLIMGGDGSDVIYARGGNDTVDGGDGGDRVVGGSGDDSLVGGRGADSIVSGSGENTIEGGIGNDRLRGGKEEDTIEGGAGKDTIAGRNGDDVLSGGTGADVFEYRTLFFDAGTPIELQVIDYGNDVILDFEDGVDKIRLSPNNATDINGLTIEAVGSHAVISFGNSSITVLDMAGQFDATDFVFG